MDNKTLIVDGMALLFRAYYATSYGGYIRRTASGTPTNAIYGFVQYMFDAIKQFRPTHVICCWDMGSKTFRSEMFDQYKSNRAAPPEELIPQFDLVKDVVEALGIPNFGLKNFEADDCIGTLSNLVASESEVVILTGDHDMLQLLTDRISVAIMKKGMGNYLVYTPQLLWEEKQITPEQMIDLKGFMGDTSDNYPGVKGIGEKTALKLLQQFSCVEEVLGNLDKLTPTVRKKIEADRDMLVLSKTLATIKKDAPVECELAACRLSIKRETAEKMFKELEFDSLVKLIG
jgi:5'-3' exonuclease